jgi:hypothetical protein
VSSAAKRQDPTDPMWPPRMYRTADDDPKVMANYRIPKSVKALLEEAEFQGLTQTDAMMTAVEFLRDVMKTMGEDWWKVLKEAQDTKTPHGILIARMALEAIRAQSKKK